MVPNIYSFGHSDGIIFYDPSLAEPLPSQATFVVNGSTLQPFSTAGPLMNGNFEEHVGNHLDHWANQDQSGSRTFFDPSCRSDGCVRISAVGPKWARLGQPGISVPPSAQVLIRCSVAARNLSEEIPKGNVRFQLNQNGGEDLLEHRPFAGGRYEMVIARHCM